MPLIFEALSCVNLFIVTVCKHLHHLELFGMNVLQKWLNLKVYDFLFGVELI